jgi:hypothetical protein
MTDFADPSTGGDKLPLDDLNGSLLYIEALSFETGIDTVNGVTDAVRANVVALDGARKGERFDDALIFPRVLRSSLRPNIGQKTLGRLTKGTAKPGKSAPWVLEPANDAEKAIGQKYLAYAATLAPAEEEPESPF